MVLHDPLEQVDHLEATAQALPQATMVQCRPLD